MAIDYSKATRRIAILSIIFFGYFCYLFCATVYDYYDLISSVRENPKLWDAIGYRIWMIVVPALIALLFWKRQLVGWILMVGLNVVLFASSINRLLSLLRVFSIPDISVFYLLNHTTQIALGLLVSIGVLRYTRKSDVQAVFCASKEQYWLVVGIVVLLILGRLMV